MKHITCLISLLCFAFGYCKEPECVYIEFFKKNQTFIGPIGDHTAGEIEIVVDQKKIESIEDLYKQKFIREGMSEKEAHLSSRVGLIAEDKYWMWIRDPVIFPGGTRGLYDRIVRQRSLDGDPSVAVLPLLPDGRIVLNLNYRHATRAWELELPRGGRKEGETIEAAAQRELQEETGLWIDTSRYLGTVAPDTGCSSATVPVFLGTVSKSGKSNQEFSEAILRIESFTPQEVRAAFIRGYMEVEIKGKTAKAFVRDPFLAYALLLANL